jgi:CRISPR/Cas system CSM-associated protein Csm3 (group 7 of RAMP superfamily)
MYQQRVDFTLTLELLSDVHIGCGESGLLSEIRDNTKEQDKGDPSVLVIQRDAQKRPWLPPTSLKGAFRSTGALDEDKANNAFGGVRTTDWSTVCVGR